jgi:cobalt/nickel transport system permease protein
LHIPDGYLSPASCAALGAAVAPAWVISAARLKGRLGTHEIPRLALGSAFSFVVMMFNVPAPGGTSGHAVGAGLVAILLGPAAAVVTTTVALAIQALMFRDGGLLPFGANCFNMAFVMPVVTFAVYRALCIRERWARWRASAAGVAAYVGLNAAALATAVELGIQPAIARAPDGTPLFCPYGLGVSIPGVMIWHLLLFGPVEAVATAGVVRWAEREGLAWEGLASKQPRTRLAWAGLGALCLLSPLGLLAAGDAWGEWAPEDLKERLGWTPPGIERFAELWQGVFPDYMKSHGALGYILSAVLGATAITLVIWVFGRILARAETAKPAGAEPPAAGIHPRELPSWLSSRASVAPCACCGIARSSSFAERTLVGLAAVVRESLESSREAMRAGVLQSLDARAKLVAALVLITGVALSRSLVAVAGASALAVLLARASHVDVGSFLKRTWLVVPLFTAALALPAVLNVVTPGPEIARLFATPEWLQRAGWPSELAVTATGVRTSLQIVLRAGASLSVAGLVTRTTPPGEVLGAVRALGVPRAFVLVATMTERHVLALVKTIEEMHLALVSRRLRPLAPETGRAFVTSRMGVVLTKTRATAEEVHLAMVARGFRGEVKTLREPSPRGRDALALALAAALGAAIVLAGVGGLP